MTDEQKLYELLKKIDSAVEERMEKHFKDGAFYFDLGGSSYPFFEGNTVYTVIPHFAEKGSEGIVKKLKRLMEKDLKEKEPVRWLQKKTDRSVIIRATVYLTA